MAEIPEVEEVPVLLLPCVTCGRTFKPEALAKHSNYCEKQQAKKRKKFDSAKQRIQGTELADFLGPPPLGNKPKPPSPKKAQSRWKEKHEALKKTIRDEPTKPPDHQQCPYCERFFGPKPYDRHVEWCKEQHSKIPPNINLNKDVHKAKERLQARTKYKAPQFKSQRTLTKEKYSPGRHVSQSNLGMSTSATFPSPSLPSEKLHRTVMSSSSTDLGLNMVESSGYGKSRSSSISSTMPSLTRQGSLRSNRNIDSTYGDTKKNVTAARNNKESSVMSTPVLTRKQRGSSVSSQGSLEGGRSTSSSNYSVNTCISDTTHKNTMSHQETANKPHIITSQSTNSLNRRWSPINEQLATSMGQDDSALSKFCHECGGRYPVPGAKFCCICGVRRLAV